MPSIACSIQCEDPVDFEICCVVSYAQEVDNGSRPDCPLTTPCRKNEHTVMGAHFDQAFHEGKSLASMTWLRFYASTHSREYLLNKVAVAYILSL